MKFVKKLIAAGLFLSIFGVAPANSVQPTGQLNIAVTEPSHRQLDGKFIDDDLADLISFNGRLGQLIYAPPRGYKTWLIDAQLVDDVSAMANGYKLVSGQDGTGKNAAALWLAQLKRIAIGQKVVAIPYGNPSRYWIHTLSPHNESYFLAVGAARLSKFFNRPVDAMSDYFDTAYFHLNATSIQAFNDAQSAINDSASYMDPQVLDDNHSRIAELFNSNLNKSARLILENDLETLANSIMHQIRLAPGRFTISSRKQNLPITVINDFPGKARVNLKITALNGKVVVGDVAPVDLSGKSKVQVLVPIQVLTSGNSSLAISLQSINSNMYGDEVIYPLTLRVINPIATWITTGAAIVLFISALIQSIRRIRKRGK
jgi:Family of unknown function (DUF6049)